MRARPDPFAKQDRLGRRGHRANYVGPRGSLPIVCDRSDRPTGLLGHPIRDLASLFGRLSPKEDLAKRPHKRQRMQMRFRLKARAEDGENVSVGTGERIGCGCGRASRADFGDRLGVGDAADRSGHPIIGNDHALMARASRPIRVPEHADQLRAERRKSRQLAGHGPEHLVLADREDLPQRLRSLPARKSRHRLAHRLDAARIIEQLLDLRRVVKGNRHGGRL